MPFYKQYSGMWTRQAQMQAAAAQTWPNIYLGDIAYAVGNGTTGNLGINEVVLRSSPVQIGSSYWSSVSAGRSHSVAVSSGRLFSWGYNLYGQLGDGTSVNRSAPTQIGALTTWSQVSAGRFGSCAIKTDGTLWAWGINAFGTLGQNNTIYRSSPVQVGSGTTWLNASSGAYTITALKTDGTMWAWGNNGYGQLGQNDITHRSSPVQVGSLTTWLKISGHDNYTTAAVKTDGTLWTLGFNAQGQLGQNSVAPKSSPVQIGSLTSWSDVSTSVANSFFLDTSGRLWACGYNNYGTLGTNTTYTINRSSPVQVGGSEWAKVSSGLYNGFGVKTDGTLWAWGYNGFGQLGDGTVINRSSPVQIGSSTNWSYPSAGGYTANFLAKVYTT